MLHPKPDSKPPTDAELASYDELVAGVESVAFEIDADDDDEGDDSLDLDEADCDDLLETRQLIAEVPRRVSAAARDRSRRPSAGYRSTAGHGRPSSLLRPYTGGQLASASRQRQSKLYSPWTIFSLTILFFLFLYIPLFNTYRDSAGMYPIPGWELNTTRDTSYYVLPQYNTTLIDAQHVCDDRLFLLIVVCSAADNFEIRDSIRQTWANMSEFNYSFFRRAHAQQRGQYLDIDYPHWTNYTTSFRSYPFHEQPSSHSTITAPAAQPSSSPPPVDNPPQHLPEFADFAVRIVFLVGQTASNETQSRLTSESADYGDLIQESFFDSYNNLTLKTIMMLKWVNVNCADRLQFLMKCDDDTFVNVPNLLHVLLGGTVPVYNATAGEHDAATIKTRAARNRLRIADAANLLIGSRFCHSKPISNTSSKWYTPVYMYSGSVYPNYLSGTGYVMSAEVALRLYNASLVTPIFHLEDVYLTGICAEAAHIRPANHQLFSYTAVRNPCELKGMVTKHQLSAADMRRAYAFVRDGAAKCPRPDRYYHVRKVKTNTRSCS